MRRVFSSLALALVLSTGCSKSEEPKSEKPAASAAPAPSTTLPPVQERLAAALRDAGYEIKPHQGKLEKDDAGHYIPTTPPPPVNSADLPPQPSRDPDPDLDLDDPARDYVTRYVISTMRYGDKTGCVVVGKSTDAGAPKRLVEVRDNKNDTACGGSDALRDVFVVDVGADRLSKKDPKVGAPLRPWPDGSDPEAPAKGMVSIDDMKEQWKTPLRDALKALRLTPIRVQLYLRGSYPVITLAGFRAPLAKDTRPQDMQDALTAICKASAGLPMSFLGGVDRSTTLRLRCNPPPGARWDRF